MVNWEGRRESSNVIDLRKGSNLEAVAQEVWKPIASDEAFARKVSKPVASDQGSDGKPILPELEIEDPAEKLKNSVDIFGSRLIQAREANEDSSASQQESPPKSQRE